MRLLPERSWLPQHWPPPVRRRAATLLLISGVGAAGVLSFGWWSNQILEGVYEHWRPRLERQLGKVMGHPLELGPYRGLGVDGLRIGPSRFLPGPQDRSTAGARGLTVQVHPVASWRRRSLVLDLRLAGVRADLRRNARGQFWVLGKLPPGEPPRLDLRFHLSEPAAVTVHGLTAGRDPLVLSASGAAGLRTHRRELDLNARLASPGRQGEVGVRGEGQWKARRWRATISPRDLPLAPFAALLPLRGPLDGSARGSFTLTLDRGMAACRGSVDLRGLRWRPAAGGTPLQAGRLPLQCRGRELVLASSGWRYGDWRGLVAGRAALDRRLAVRVRVRPPTGNALGATPIDASLQGRWSDGALRLARLEGRRGASTLQAGGSLGRTLDLSGRWTLDPAELPAADRLPPWVRERPLSGSLRAEGRPGAPRLSVRTGQADHPLLGPWQASLAWSDGLLRLARFSAPNLWASARLPLALRRGRGLVPGELEARLRVEDLPLARLQPLLGAELSGELAAAGSVRGPLRALRPDLDLTVRRPGAGPLLLQETWRGTLVGDPPGSADAGRLQLAAVAPAPAGRIDARLDRRWLPVAMELRRQGGRLTLSGTPQAYRWTARGFPLGGLALLLGPQRTPQPVQGELSGKGVLSLQPLAFQAEVDLARPQFLGVGGKQIAATVDYRDRAYRLEGTVEPLTAGRIDVEARGRWQGPVKATFRARGLNSVLFQQLAEAWPRFRGAPVPAGGHAADLGPLAIRPTPGSLLDQLRALEEARILVAERDAELASATRAERIARLQIGIDADLTVQGPDLRRARAEMVATGHVWKGLAGLDRAVTDDPFEVRLEGPLGAGEGSFEAQGLALALLNLVVPVPGSLRGQLGLRGRYRLGGGSPAVQAELALQDTFLGESALRLERGAVDLKDGMVTVDLALRAEGAANSVDLAGTIPLNAARSGLELRLASRDDGLVFLTQLAGRAFRWERGRADLQLLVRGSLDEPIANGFLRISDGRSRFIGQTLRDVQATVLFDFEQLLVQELSARVGNRGRIQGSGVLGLVRPLTPEPSLQVSLEQVPFSLRRITAVGDGRLWLGGSLVGGELGGDVRVSRGTVNAQPGSLAASEPVSDAPARPSSFDALVESRWDFQEPLVLLGPEVESPTGESLREGLPRFPWLSFRDLRVELGPDLRVEIPNVASFSTGGSLRVSGRLDPSLRASGVVRLLGGRLSLFTTTFSLDPDAPNVAIFTPSLGLVPYLDVALRTRISDSLATVAPRGFGTSGGAAPSLAEIEGQSGFSSFSQLELILVTVSVSGPADRIAENLRLRSSPPLPQERLVALIGGNSLAGLSGGGAGTALATVVGQSLLSPLLSSFSDLFGQRVSLALYPTYVNPDVKNERELFSRRVPPQLVLGTELGVDLTERFNASVLAAPNRSDVPPQFTFTYKASDTFNLQGAIDTQGSWQSQLQVFFRF
ncbi:MAG: translocation/assembly module TamB domain-containing protein [Synechococcaceae cyanobacterium]|nr:translocation/assembly module TamB domain-containing protein [Synechococcaceae cyanobacterium]